ncbi:MAG: glycoside hydrolase family 99-like domain-containing protein [Planktothrix sp. GU0601_MAG3]|nr:MAG: glycoside hydrolase family 99-like domain-containing protein [Planktothrix sp. GU0601_MAG3]
MKLLCEQECFEEANIFLRRAVEIEPKLIERLEQLLRQRTSEQVLTDWEQEQIRGKALTKNIPHAASDLTVNSKTTDVRLIAFYLPQYHPIPENDKWWGKGFTEWTNVTKAKPLFKGHYQPHLPADLGFYDLRLPEVREAQADLAKRYGVYGFCYYYYWFNGKRLLEYPLDDMLTSGKPDFPFCICWANENWTRRWDGLEQEILIAQEYSDGSYQDFAESLIPYLSDPRYIRVQGHPLILVYRIAHLPKPKEAISIWRQVFRERGIGEVHIAGVLGFGLHNPVELGCDSGVQFPPNSISSFPLSMPELVSNNNFSGAVHDYKQAGINTLKEKFPDYQLFPTIMTSWDNTARRQKNATVWLNSETRKL